MIRRTSSLFLLFSIALIACAGILNGCASDPEAPPVIASLSPSGAVAGGAAFTLKVIGSGFKNTDVVQWNGSALATQPVSSSELDAQVPGNLIQSAAKVAQTARNSNATHSQAQLAASATGTTEVKVTVFRKPPGSVTSNAVTFTITSGPTTPDFTIGASPASQSVSAGGNTTYSITVSALGGFAGAVGLTVSNLPSGATAGFVPGTVDGSGTSVLTITTAISTPAGTSTLTITGTSGTLTHTATVTLIVTSGSTPDFSILGSPASQTAAQGGTTSFGVSVTALNGFSGAVSLSVAGLPAGTNGNFTPASVSGSGTSTLNIAVGVSTTPGNYTLTITGTSGSLTHHATVVLVVTSGGGGSGLFISIVFAQSNAPTFADTNVIVKFGNNGSTPITGVTVAITGMPSTTTPVNISVVGIAGNCTITNLTCTLTTALPAGSDPLVVLTYQAAPGTATFTGTATVSAPGSSSVNSNFNATFASCSPGPGTLCGQYFLFAEGFTTSGSQTIATSFTADGAGHVTNATLDYNSGNFTQSQIGLNAASTYSFDASGVGTLTFNTANGTFLFKFALDPGSGTFGSVIEFLPPSSPIPFVPLGGGSGFLQLQAPEYFVSQVVGTYGFALIGGLGPSGTRVGMLGTINANGNCGFGSTGATGTINSGGTVSRNTSFSGSLGGANCFVFAADGRGQGGLTSITGTPAPSFSAMTFSYYILDLNPDGTANHILLVSADPASATQPILAGMLTSQHNAPYSTNSALDCAKGTNLGCVFAFSGATGGNSLTGNSYVLAGLASLTTQSNIAGAFSLLRDENSGGTVSSSIITASYKYNADGTGSYTPSSGEVIDFVLTDIDTGFTLSEGTNVSYGFFAPESSPSGPFNPTGLAAKPFYAGSNSLGTAAETATVGLATVTQSPPGSNTGTFSGNIDFWNNTAFQNSSVLTGTYTTDTLTTRVTGTSNIPGAASFAIYQLSSSQFVLIGTTNSDTKAALLVF